MRTVLLLVLGVLLVAPLERDAAGARRAPTKRLVLGEELTLAFGEQAVARDGLRVLYAGVEPGEAPSPDLRFGRGTRADAPPLWAAPLHRRADEPVGSALWGEVLVRVTEMEDEEPYRIRLVVTPAAGVVPELLWGAPHVLEPYGHARLPDGRRLALVEVTDDTPRVVSLRVLAADGSPDTVGTIDTIDLACVDEGPPLARESHEGTMFEVRSLKPRDRREAVELAVWLPAHTVRPLALGAPLTLFPGETARESGGLAVRLSGYGRTSDAGGADVPFVVLSLSDGGPAEDVRILRAPGTTPVGPLWPELAWRGYLVTAEPSTDGPLARPETPTVIVVRKR